MKEDAEGYEDEHFGRAYAKLREQLMHRLGDVDAQILVSIVSLRPGKAPRGGAKDFFSDWPDSYNRDSWYKTWGKGGGIAEVPSEFQDPADSAG